MQARDLEQGDLLENVLLPLHHSETSYHQRLDKNVSQLGKTGPHSLIMKPDSSVRMQVATKLCQWAMVVSNSCDIYQDKAPVWIAEVRPFEFRTQPLDPASRWRDVSTMATSPQDKSFYVAAFEPLKLARSEVPLAHARPVAANFLQRQIDSSRAKRRAGLTDAALRHLHWQLSLLFTRNARLESDWMSPEDHQLLGEARSFDQKRRLMVVLDKSVSLQLDVRARDRNLSREELAKELLAAALAQNDTDSIDNDRDLPMALDALLQKP